MAFPFVAPFAPWVREIMRERENNRNIGMFKNPYVVISSGALVLKHSPSVNVDEKNEILRRILKNPEYAYTESTQVYRGCIVSNNITDVNLSYSKYQTLVGVDFDGNPIAVEGEEGRLVSTPIIEGLEIDTDGANNTTKTARVSVKCFTLKQLEMFEMFFMKPGMNVLIEFGDATILGGQSRVTLDESQLQVWRNGALKDIRPAKSIHECLIRKDDFATFRDEFGKYYRADITGTIAYFENIEKSLGSWDMLAGKVTNYSYTYSEGVYNVSFEVTQSNQLSIALPCNPKRKTGAESSKDKKTAIEYLKPDQILDTIAYNLDLDKKILNVLMSRPHPETGKTGAEEWIKKETFNFVKIDEDHSDSAVSQNAYVSLRFILHILMNYVLGKDGELIKGKTDEADTINRQGGNARTFGFTVPSGLVDDVQVEIIPIRIVDNIMSSSEDVIYPNANLPKMKVVSTKTKNPQGEDNKIVMDKQTIDNGKINGYDIRLDTERIPNVYHQEEGFIKDEKTGKMCGPILKVPPETIEVIRKDDDGNEEKIINRMVVGNALNIFVNFRQVISMWNKEIYRVDFLEKLLSVINRNSYGQFQLVYAPINENGPATIIDYKFCEAIPDLDVTSSDIMVDEDYYRFQMTPNKSNVLDFNFSFEMGNLIAGQTVFNQNKLVNKILEANEGVKNPDGDGIKIPEAVFKSVDKSTMANSDGWYTINLIEYESILAKAKRIKEKQDALSKDTKLKNEEPKEEKEEGPDKQGLEDFIHEKSLRFITDPKKYVPPSPPPAPNVTSTGQGQPAPKGFDPKTRKPLPANATPEAHNLILEIASQVQPQPYDPDGYGQQIAGLDVNGGLLSRRKSALKTAANLGKIETAAGQGKGFLDKWLAGGGEKYIRWGLPPNTYEEEYTQLISNAGIGVAATIWNATYYSPSGIIGGQINIDLLSTALRGISKDTLIRAENALVGGYGAQRGGDLPGEVIVGIINAYVNESVVPYGPIALLKRDYDSIMAGVATMEFETDSTYQNNSTTATSKLRPNTLRVIGAAKDPKATNTPSAGTASSGGGTATPPKPNYAGTTVLIYKDQPFLIDKFGAVVEASKKRSSLAPINVTLTVQGFSGFRCGYCFNVTGVPEKFNEDGIFQITNVKHSVGQEGWKTTIEATFNYRRKRQ